MSVMTARRRRSFTAEFKAKTVELVRTSGKSVAEVCRDLNLTETAVRRWVAQAEIDAGQRDRLTTTEREELGHLRKEVRVLRQESAILGKATGLFAQEANPGGGIRSSARRRPTIPLPYQIVFRRSPRV